MKHISVYNQLIHVRVSALRYLSLGHHNNEASKTQTPEQPHQVEPRPSTASSVYEVARPILQGCHAVPTKLKILLDRALSSLKHEEVIMIVSGCGWHLEDYQRGYKLKVRMKITLLLFLKIINFESGRDFGGLLFVIGKVDIYDPGSRHHLG